MKYSVAVMLFLGAISTAEAIQLEQRSAGFLQSELYINNPPSNQQALQVAQDKAKDAAKKVEDSKKKIDALKKQQSVSQNSKPVSKTLQKVDPTKKDEEKKTLVKKDKPAHDAKIQTQSSMDVKTGSGLVVSVEAVKKPEGSNKIQELAAMEEALKKAQEEAHSQRLALTGGADQANLAQGTTSAEAKALAALQKKQEEQQKALLEQLAEEEKARQIEIKQNEELESKIAMAEKERQQEEVLAKSRAEELKKLQEEEAAQKLVAEKMEQEFLAAQAVQETKAAAAKKAAAKANLARLKRKHELQRRKAEAQLQMLKVRQQMEAEQALELEKTKTAEEAANPKPVAVPVVQLNQAKSSVQSEAEKKAAEQLAAENKAKAEKAAAEKAAAEAKHKAEVEAQKKAEAEAKKKAAIEAKKKAEAEKKAAEARAAAEKKAAAEKAKKEAEHMQKLDKMNQLLDQFSVTLNKKHFDAALAVKDEIKAAGFEEPAFKVKTVAVYKKQFTFPQIANNDYAVEQFEALGIAEQNLNNDLTNETGMTNFLHAADEVAHNLTERYKEQWVDPKDDRNKDTD